VPLLPWGAGGLVIPEGVQVRLTVIVMIFEVFVALSIKAAIIWSVTLHHSVWGTIVFRNLHLY
jgi:hypothetical protein